MSMILSPDRRITPQIVDAFRATRGASKNAITANAIAMHTDDPIGIVAPLFKNEIRLRHRLDNPTFLERLVVGSQAILAAPLGDTPYMPLDARIVCKGDVPSPPLLPHRKCWRDAYRRPNP